MPDVLPYGAWPSPITSDVLVAGELRLGWPAFGPEGALLWQERRPSEGGRGVVVRRGPDGERRDVTPEGFDVRTRVHEYGGAAWLLVGLLAALVLVAVVLWLGTDVLA